MISKKLSVIIPSYKDPLLVKTIESVLQNAEGNIEVIAVLDGYKPKFDIPKDPRVKLIQLEKNVGMREALNIAVQNSDGEYLMRTDEHCVFGQGFDRIVLETIEDNWIVIPRRYFLDPIKWELMDTPPVDYEKLMIIKLGGEDVYKFSAIKWPSRTEKRKDIAVDETMGYQGSCWFTSRKHWDALGNLQSEGYGTHYQDSIEMSFKTWKLGGKVMLNKSTWYAHKHRSFPRTHGYGGQAARDGFTHAIAVWKDYYEQEIRPRFGV